MTVFENKVTLPNLYATENTASFLTQVAGTAVTITELPVGRDLGEFVVPLIAATVDLKRQEQSAPNATLNGVREDVRVTNLRLLGVNSLTEISDVVGIVSNSVNIDIAKTATAKRYSGSVKRVIQMLRGAPGYDEDAIGHRYQRFLESADHTPTVSREMDAMVESRALRLDEIKPQPALDDQRTRLEAYLRAGFKAENVAEQRALGRFLLAGTIFRDESSSLAGALEQMAQLIDAAKTYVPNEQLSPTFRQILAFQPGKVALLEHVIAVGRAEIDGTVRTGDAQPLSGLGVLVEQWPTVDEHVLRENLVQAVRRVVIAPTADTPLPRIWGSQDSRPLVRQAFTLKSSHNRRQR